MSKNIDDGGPAFPVSIMERQADGKPLTGYDFGVQGMTLRDWFAGMAMQGILIGDYQQNLTALAISEYAFQQADAMIDARGKEGA